ncbi:MAG: hypothetical protein NZ827_01910 [Aquificaceae bacterium]|nr:hypothetical protein [Aquificaceae bacterium]
MKAEKFWLYFSLSFLLVVGFSLINLTVFMEMRGEEEEQLYLLASQHFKHYLCNPEHRGDEYVSINPTQEGGYRIYTFEEPGNPPRAIRIGIRQELFEKKKDRLLKKLLFVEFILVFTLVFLYQTVVEGYIKKLKEREEWVRGLMLSLTHRLGNFMATQKVLLALLKKSYPEEINLKKLEKSLTKAQKDFHIFTNLVREDKGLNILELNLSEYVRESLVYFEDQLEKKRVILGLRDFWVRMDKADLEDVLYNLIGNAVKHSESFLHIRICPKGKALIVSNDVGKGAGGGMGMGAELTRSVLKRYGYELRIRLKRRYTAFLRFT